VIQPYYQDEWVTIYHGDCREILPELQKVDLVLTDPPYGVKIAEWDVMTGMGWLTLCRQLSSLVMFTSGITNMFDYPKPDWIASWSMPNGEKRSKGGGINNWEPVLIYGKNPLPLDHKQFYSLSSNEKQHPTAKPLQAWLWLMSKSSQVEDLILDPFLGSGTTAYCAKKLNRKCIGIEIEEKYCEIAARRCSQSIMRLLV